MDERPLIRRLTGSERPERLAPNAFGAKDLRARFERCQRSSIRKFDSDLFIRFEFCRLRLQQLNSCRQLTEGSFMHCQDFSG